MNIKKRILSFLLAIVMILTVVPALTVSAEPEAVDLIHKDEENKNIKEGVFVTSSGEPYNATETYQLSNAINGNKKDRWCSKFKPDDFQWIQINLPAASQWTKVVVVGADNADYLGGFQVLASNDPNFETNDVDVLLDKVGKHKTDLANRTFEITGTDESGIIGTYRYLRVIATEAKRFGVAEIDIEGYEPELPKTEDFEELTQKPDVYAKVATEDAKTYKAQQVLDQDDATGYVVTDADKPELIVDLRRESDIKMIEFTPVAGDEAYRMNYTIQTSNSPTVFSDDAVYTRLNNASEDGATVRAYMPDGLSARYVRIKSDSSSLGVAELKVWGTESSFTLENMVSPAYVTATLGENPEYTADNNVETVWESAEEATKSALIYDLEGAMTVQEKSLLPVTSIMLLPADGEESRKNFNIYGSETGDFGDEDAELITAVDDTPLAIGQYEIITLDEPKAYKSIKIEKAEAPCAAKSLAFREVKIIHNSLDTEVKVESTLPANGATGVTNFGSNPEDLTNLIEVELNRNIKGSINPENVIIKDITDGADTVLTDWEVYAISDNKFSIDVANLSSNKTYEVTLTTNINTTSGPLNEEQKFTFSTGNVAAFPYDPNKVLVNVALGKNITGNVNSSYASSNPLSKIIDDDSKSYSVTGTPKVQIDLGNFYDIVAFELVPNSTSSHKNLLRNLKVLASDTSIDYPNSSTDALAELTVATYPAESDKTELLMLDESVEARYIGLYRASTYMVLCEARVYAYVDKSFLYDTWKVNDSAEITEFDAEGTYKFSIDVNNLSGSKPIYYMTVFAYDENGVWIQKKNQEIEISVESGKQTLEADIELTKEEYEKATHITAVLYKSQGDATMVVDAKTITTKREGANLSGPTEISAKDSVKLEHTAKSDYERVAVQILSPNDEGVGREFDLVNGETFNTALCYSNGTGMLAKDETATFYFKVPNKDLFGVYNIRMTVTKADGTTEKYDSYLLYLDEAQIDECIKAFDAVNDKQSADEISKLIGTWSDSEGGKKYFNMTDLPAALSTSVPNEFAKMFELIFDIYFDKDPDADKYYRDGKKAQITDLVDCINGAYIMAMYEAGDTDAVKTALKDYAGDINGLYKRIDATTKKEIIDVDRYSTVYTALKGNITDEDTLKSVMKWAEPLSLIQGGTERDVKAAMEKYDLGHDLSYATDKGVTLAEVAKKIDTTNASEFYNAEGTAFKKAFEAAVDAVLADPEITVTPDSTVPPVVSDGVGAHGSRPASPSKPEDKPVTPVTPAEPDVEKAPFNDVENIAWAKDYINTLYKEGVISGDGDGKFHPNRQVTREEFLKMLIEALKIDVASKEAAEFDDCDANAWYYPYVQIASSNKITKGINRKNFGIGQNITRQDMAVLLSKALAVKNVTAIESDYVFDDDNKIGDYAKSDVSKMYSLGMISGMGNGTFAPQEFTTRAQAAVIIGRALEILGGASK